MVEPLQIGVTQNGGVSIGPQRQWELVDGRIVLRAGQVPLSYTERVEGLNQKIQELQRKVESLRSSIDDIEKSCSEERERKLEIARRMHGIPQRIGSGEILKFLQGDRKQKGDSLGHVKRYRDLLTSLVPRPTLKIYDLGEGDVASFTLPHILRQITAEVTQCREKDEELLKRIYFESQGGAARRSGRGAGDEVAFTTDLDGCTCLDGWTFSAAFINVYQNLKAFYESLPLEEQRIQDPHISPLFDKLNQARLLFFMIDCTHEMDVQIVHQQQSIMFLELAQQISMQVCALQPGDSILLPGGTSNHGLAYEIIRQFDDKITFTLYNGAPSEENHKKIGGKYSNICIRNVDPDMLDKVFFTRLYGLTLRRDVEEIYDHLKNLGNVESDCSYHYPQGIGDCASRCLLRWLKKQMGSGLYRRMRAFTLQALLERFSGRFGGKMCDDTTFRIVTRDGAEAQLAWSSINTLIRNATRSLQKIKRSIFIEEAVNRALQLDSRKECDEALQKIWESKEVRETLLNDQDRCLTLWKIAVHLTGHPEAQRFFDKAVRVVEEIQNAEEQSATFYEIAQSLFLLGRDEDGHAFLSRSAEAAEKISDPGQRAAAFFDLAKEFFSQKGSNASWHCVDRAIDAAIASSDPNKSSAIVIKICHTLCLWDAFDQALSCALRPPFDEQVSKFLFELCMRHIYKSDFVRAVRVLNAMPPSDGQDIAGPELLRRVHAQGEPDPAHPIIEMVLNPMIVTLHLSDRIFNLLSQGNHAQALDLSYRLPEVDYRANALMAIAKQLFSKDPEGAKKIMYQAIEAAREIPIALTTTARWNRHYPRWWTFFQMAEIFAFDWNKGEWEDLLEEALRSIRGILDPRQQDKAREEIAQTFHKLDLPDRFSELL